MIRRSMKLSNKSKAIKKDNNVSSKVIVTALKKKEIVHQVYQYSKLSECLQNENNTIFNFLAVVVAANYPHIAKSERFVCTMRIIDPYQPLSKDGVFETCTLVLFANRFEDLPISQRVGDIIRVHRVSVSEYKGVKQFTARVYFNSAWPFSLPVLNRQLLSLVMCKNHVRSPSSVSRSMKLQIPRTRLLIA